MTLPPQTPLLDRISGPEDLRALSDTDLAALAGELRAETIQAVSRTGGHLGAGLGVVELTVALHAVFDTPRDRLIWDVGHQAYPHKILTGRRAAMESLRQAGGLSGFTKRDESPFDPFGAGHASTSISAALGFAMGARLGGETEPPLGDAIAVIGDGAMSGGMAFEALNHAGHLGQRLFVVLNDNERSIDPPVGMTRSGAMFAEFGLEYRGPVDGHDMAALLAELRAARDTATGPVLIHVKTRKGKGYGPAESAADGGHATEKFNLATGAQEKAQSKAPSYSKVFGQTLLNAAQTDKRVVAITAAMAEGTGLAPMAEALPDRVFDVGIAEQHAVTFAAGLAAAGMRPFAAIYSTFLQRGLDQVIHDVAIQSLPVRFMIDRAGLVGADGPTHAGAFDLAFLSNLPEFVVMAPSDEAELARMVVTAQGIDGGPSAVRYPRGAGLGVAMPEPPTPLPIGKARVIREGRGVAILSLGTRLSEVLVAADLLADEGITPTIVDARFAKPLDEALIAELAQSHDALVTIEEGAAGGFGARVAEYLSECGFLRGQVALSMMTLPDRFIPHGSPDAMYEAAGLTAPHIADHVRKTM